LRLVELMSPTTPYDIGYRDGRRSTIVWLQERAAHANDPDARRALETAAINLSWEEADR